MRKPILLLLCLCSILVLNAQNYTDTISALGLNLNTQQLELLKQAQHEAKLVEPLWQNYAKEKQEIESLKTTAETISTASQKKKALKKILKKEKDLLKAQAKYLASTQPESSANYALFVDIVKLMTPPINDFSQQIIDSLKSASAKKNRIAVSKRKKSERVKSIFESVSALEGARTNELLAISDLSTIIKISLGKITLTVPAAVTPPAEVVVQAKAPKEIPYEEIHIIYKIQIAASRIELSNEKLFSLYRPSQGEMINSEIEDGWYKYSVGRYHTYAEANDNKEKLAVKGAFIIAYRDQEKIQVKRDDNSKLDIINGQEVVYRIQISATRNPATPTKVKEMNMSGRIVNITQKDGWFKYTVGNFASRNEAEASLKSMAVRGAFVVAYSTTGEEMRLEGF